MKRDLPAPLSDPLAAAAAEAVRIEKDFLGEKAVPADAYYGVQTLRGKENFHITGLPMSIEPAFVKAFGYVKKARRWRIAIWACWRRRSPMRSPPLVTG